MIMKKTRICSLLLVFLFLFLLPLTVFADDNGDGTYEKDLLSRNQKPYSFLYEEGEKEAFLQMHPIYAERGNVDLRDAFVQAREKGASMFLSIGSVKIYLTARLVSDVAERGDPVFLYIEKLSSEDETTDVEEETTADELPRDVIYRFDLGFPFSYRSVRIAVKHPTSNADKLNLIASDESGTETVLKSAYDDSLASFFPKEEAFTLRITETPLPEKAPPIPLLLASILLLLVLGSVVLLVLIKTGRLKRIYLTRFEGNTSTPSL